MTTGVSSSCPQCGAPLRFGGASSLAAVCAYCRFAVLRTGARLDVAGKVPDLVATDTRLSIGTAGKAQGRTFTLLGRLQLSQGEAVWNEWYGSFGDTSWGWVAEAQGRLYVTFPVLGAAGLPPLSALRPGADIRLPGLGRAVVDEVNTARLVSFEGELPVRPELASSGTTPTAAPRAAASRLSTTAPGANRFSMPDARRVTPRPAWRTPHLWRLLASSRCGR